MKIIFKSYVLVAIFFWCYMVIGYFATKEKAKEKEVYKPRLKPVDDDTSYLLHVPSNIENRIRMVNALNQIK